MRDFSLGSHIVLLLSILCSSTGTALAQGLSAPTLRATAFEGHTVALQWTDGESYSTNRIERKSGGSDWTLIAEASQANSYWDRSTVAGVTYTYRVQAVTSQGLFTYSNEASTTTEGPTLQPPATPYFTADVSFNNINLRWTPKEGVSEYKIEMLDANTPWHELITLGGGSSNYIV